MEKIIDGINVEECEWHLSTGYCQIQMVFQGLVLKLPFGQHLECDLCKKDCYFKQLKKSDKQLESIEQKLNKIEEYIKNFCSHSCCMCGSPINKSINCRLSDIYKIIMDKE